MVNEIDDGDDGDGEINIIDHCVTKDDVVRFSTDVVVIKRVSSSSCSSFCNSSIASSNSSCDVHVIGLDSQASHSVTSELDLFGDRDLKNNITFQISDWANETKLIDEHGDTIFGSVIYAKEAEGTIVCMTDMYNNWKVKWLEQRCECIATLKSNSKIILHFKNNGNKVLNAQVDKELWDYLCNHNFTSNNEEVVIKNTIATEDMKHIMEALRFHEVTCHAGIMKMKQCMQNLVFHNPLIDSRDIDNIRLVNHLGCNACKVGKARKLSSNPESGRHNNADRIINPREMIDPADINKETLGVDIMFIQKRIYLVVVGKFIGFIHVVPIETRTKAHVKTALVAVLNDYRRNQLSIVESLVRKNEHRRNLTYDVSLPISAMESDNEGALVSLAAEELPLLGIRCSFVAADEHIGYVERQIQTVKRRYDSTCAGTKFLVNGKLMDWLVVNVVNWINIMPCPKAKESAWCKLTKRKLYYNRVTLTQFGQPVVAHKTKGHIGDGVVSGELGISLGCVLNNTGSIYFYSIITKQVKVRRRYAVASPINYADHDLEVNKQYVGSGVVVDKYKEYMKQRPSIVDPHQDISDSELLLPDEGAYMDVRPSVVVEEDSPTIYNIPIGNNMLALNDNAAVVDSREESHKTHSGINNDNIQYINDVDQVMQEARVQHDDHMMEIVEAEDELVAEIDNNKHNDDEVPIDNEVNANNAMPEYPQVRRQPSRSAKDKHAVVAIRKLMVYEGIIVKKMKTTSWKKGVVDYGDRAEEAIMSELKQIAVDYNLCTPTMASPTEYHRSHDLFDEKADGRCKARLVVGKSARGGEIDYGIDLFSPTIDMKIVKLILSLGIQSNLNLSVLDVKGAFLKSPMKTKGVFVRLEPNVVSRLVTIRKDWLPFVKNNGSLMVECNKAWYGLSAASALWNSEIHDTLVKKCGYTRHDKVRCCYYRDLGSVKAYIMLHVDDLGVLMPKDNVEYLRVVSILEAKYEELRIQTGDQVNYIGLEITRDRSNNCFCVNMSQRIAKVGLDFGIAVGKAVTNPAINREFSKNDPKDTERHSDIKSYRSLVMTAAYISLVHPEVKYHTSYLASKQSDPSVRDWEKAVHLMKYLLWNKDNSVIIKGIGVSPVINVYTDAAFDVYSNSKSHSGIAVYAGNGGCALYCSSNKQHCITRSSTDAEIVSAESGVFLGSYFRDVLEDLGVICKVVHHEDNNSCISLVKTGTESYDRKERHMVRRINYMHTYFDDVIHRSEMSWCSTEDMVADALTKDLHGDLFRKHKDSLLGTVAM